MTPFNILIILALIFTVLSIIFPKYPLLAVGVLCLCISHFVK